MPENRSRVQLALTFTALLVLSGCGQTGALVLPGSAPPASAPPTPAPEEDEDDEAQR